MPLRRPPTADPLSSDNRPGWGLIVVGVLAFVAGAVWAALGRSSDANIGAGLLALAGLGAVVLGAGSLVVLAIARLVRRRR